MAEGNHLFKDTDQRKSWVIYHDALSAWWDPHAQDLLERLGFKHRQIKACGPNTADHVECDEYNSDRTLKKHWKWTNIYKSKLMGDSPELMPLDRHLFQDLKYGCKLNVGATRWLHNKDRRKFLFNTPGNAWKSLVRTWNIAPTSERIVEDIQEFYVSIAEIVRTRGTFVDKNCHKGRRLDLFRTPIPSAKMEVETAEVIKKRVRCRTKEATMEDVAMHPDALWCMEKEMELAQDDGIKGDGSSIAALEPELEPEGPEHVAPEELIRTTDLPITWRDMHSLNHFSIRADKIRDAKLAKKQAALEEKEMLKAKKAKEKADRKAAKQANGPVKKKNKRAPKTKKKTSAFVEEESTLPPIDHVVEYYWPMGEAKGWHQATFKGNKIGEDGEQESTMEDGGGAVDMCGVDVGELDWRLLFECPICEIHTRGVMLCMKCSEFRPGACDDSDSDSDF